jgi:Sec-independent protein translocase protein TatA
MVWGAVGEAPRDYRPCHLGLPHLPSRIYDEAMSFSDTVFLFFLVLILFGPKKLPEIARQAGKLLAELRRASNEFRSQIETEIAHLEVQNSQTILPPSPAPQGTVASLGSRPATSDPVPHQLESAVGLDAPTPQTAPADSNPATLNSIPSVEAVVPPSVSTAQEPHV